MNKLENWNEVTRGLYRYVIAAGCCYEIHLLFWDHAKDIMSANAKLYIVGEWCTKTHTVFEREELLTGPLAACLEAAVEDDKENNQNLK